MISITWALDLALSPNRGALLWEIRTRAFMFILSVTSTFLQKKANYLDCQQ